MKKLKIKHTVGSSPKNFNKWAVYIKKEIVKNGGKK